MSGPVLLLTHSRDHTTLDYVAQALEARGASWLRVDTDAYPRAGTLSAEADDDGDRLLLDVGGHEIDLMRVRAVWCRRIWTAAQGVDTAPAFAHACEQQAREAFEAALALLHDDVTFVNPLPAQRRADHKLLQMRMARQAGLALPPTLVSNDPAAVRAFCDAHARAGVVTKLLVPLSQTMDGRGAFVYTSPVTTIDLQDIEAVRLAPQIFQRKVNKRDDLRVVVVGDRVFSASTQSAALDWRVAVEGQRLTWRPDPLPVDVERACVALVKGLGLVVGAVDLLRDDDGALWFLEVNPAGEWGWLQMELGMPIGDAIAAALLVAKTSQPEPS